MSFRSLHVVNPCIDFVCATKLVQFPLIEPEREQIRVKIIYAGVNAIDVNIISCRYHHNREPPFEFGREAIGVIDSIGSSVPENLYELNQPVLVYLPQNGAFSEYTYKHYKSLIPIPSLKPNYLVSYVNGLTAAIGLEQAARIKPGEKVLITAAAGGTGHIALQWAKQNGCYVIGLTSSEEKANFLKQIGADCVINWKEQNLDQVLTEQFPNGIDVIWETVGRETYRILFNHLARRGRMIVLGSVSSYLSADAVADVPIEHFNTKLFRGAKTLIGFIRNEYAEYNSEYLPKLIQQIATGKLEARVDYGQNSPGGIFSGLEDVARAEEWLLMGRNVGKVVVKIQNN